MFNNFIKVAFRNLMRNKSYSLLNISGLAIGIFAFLIIMLFVQEELSYDKYHKNSDNIYRVNCNGSLAGTDFNMGYSPAPVGQAFKEEIPGVLNATRLRHSGFPVIRYNGKAFSEERWFRADSNVFEVLTIEMVQGDEKALTKPNSVILSESIAKKYFGDDNPVGKTLNSDNRTDHQVTGVFKDIPQNSHLIFDFLCSMTDWGPAQDQIWVSNNFNTYLLLEDGVKPEDVESYFAGMVQKYAGPQIQQFLGVSFEKLMEQGAHYGFYLFKMNDIHLKSKLEGEQGNTGTITYVRIFLVVGIFILIIAAINFMNLATARSAKRGREVGIRKTLGAYRAQLIAQFITESIMVSVISVIVACLLVALLLPSFNNIIGLDLKFELFNNFYMLPGLILLAIVVGFASGAYPAFFMSSIQPVKVLKGNSIGSKSNKMLRSILVVFQFFVSIALLAGTMVVTNQINYIQKKDLGYNRDNVLIVEKTDDIRAFIPEFKQEIKRLPGVISVTNSNSLFGHGYSNTVHAVEGRPKEESGLLNVELADDGYLSTYEMDLILGRDFNYGEAADSSAVIINESAVAALQLGDDPLGKRIIIPGNNNATNTIIGVVKNFHLDNLRFPIRPVAIYGSNLPGWSGGRFTAVKMVEENQAEIISSIESIWKKYAKDQAFEYTYLEDDFREQYKIEGMTRFVAIVFTTLAILIACMGLFGLASYTLEQRNKEIAIRKVMGASVRDIYTLLSVDTLKHVVIATVIAWPFSFYVMNGWLENFTYRIEFNHLLIFFGFIIAVMFSMMTVANQTLKAATSNPIKAIKYE